MAKAPRKHTPQKRPRQIKADTSPPARTPEDIERKRAEILKQAEPFAEHFREHWDSVLKQTRARSAQLAEGSKAMLRYRLIRDNQTRPPWMEQKPPKAPGDPRVVGKDLVVAAAERLKRAGSIPEGIIKTDFAEMLLAEVERVEHVRPVVIRTIVNKVKDWGLWPIDNIEV